MEIISNINKNHIADILLLSYLNNILINIIFNILLI